MQYKIDIEIQSILKHAYNEALSILKKKRTVLNDVSEALLKKENMSKEEFEKIVGKKENQNALDVSKKKKKPATKSEKKEEKK